MLSVLHQCFSWQLRGACKHSACLLLQQPAAAPAVLSRITDPLQQSPRCFGLQQWLGPSITSVVCAAEADQWQSERPELSSCSDADLVEDIRRFLEVGTAIMWASS